MIPQTSPRLFNSGSVTVLVMMFLFQMINFFDKLVFGLSAVSIMKDLKLTPAEFGDLGSSFFFLFSISGVLVGLFVVGRVQTKWILAALAAIWSVSQLPIFVTESVAVFFACRILLGLGEGPGLPTAIAHGYDWFPKEQRAIPSAAVVLGISGGFLVGGPLLGYVINTYGWRYGFLTCGGIGFAWMVLWLLVGRNGPYAVPLNTTADAASPRVSEAMLWLDPSVIGIMIMSFMSYYVVGMSAVWLPPYLQQGLGYARADVGWLVSAVFVLQGPLLLGGSYLSQWMLKNGYSNRATLGHASTLALLVSGLALAGAVYTSGTLQIALIAIAFATPSLTTIYGPVALGNMAPAAQRGRLVVVIFSANALAGLVSVAATGRVINMFADKPTGYSNAMLLAALMLVIGAAASFALMFPDRTAKRFAAAATLTKNLEVAS